MSVGAVQLETSECRQIFRAQRGRLGDRRRRAPRAGWGPDNRLGGVAVGAPRRPATGAALGGGSGRRLFCPAPGIITTRVASPRLPLSRPARPRPRSPRPPDGRPGRSASRSERRFSTVPEARRYPIGRRRTPGTRPWWARRAGDDHYRPGPPTAAPVEVSAELLGQSDDDALRATQEAEPVAVLVLRDLADEFGAVAAQAGSGGVDVLASGHDAAYAQRVRRRAFRLGSDRRRPVELRQLDPAVAVRGPHRGDVGTDVVEPDDAVHPTPLDLRLAFQLHTEFGEERFGSLEVVDNDENVVHPLNRHAPMLDRPGLDD